METLIDHTEPRHALELRQERKTNRRLAVAGVVLLAANLVAVTVLAVNAHSAAAQVEAARAKYERPLSAALAFVDRVSDTSGAVVRLFGGSVPALVENLLVADYGSFAGNVSSAAAQLHTSTCAVAGEDLDNTRYQTAKYASLVASIGKRFSGLTPVGTPQPYTGDQQTGAGGLALEPLNYVITWAKDQMDVVRWVDAGESCLALLAELEAAEWFGSYGAACNGTDASWNAEGPNGYPAFFGTVHNICSVMANA